MMFNWKSLLKNPSPLDGDEKGWQPDGLDAAFPPKPSGNAARSDGNLVLMTEFGGGSTGGTIKSTMVGKVGGLRIDLVWGSSLSSAPAGFRAIAAATQYTTDFSNPIIVAVDVG
jgi:hypothetical protein